jgi:hypothetical protein
MAIETTIESTVNLAGLGVVDGTSGIADRTAREGVSVAPNPADVESIVRAALALKGQILNEKDPAKARGLQGQLASLGTDTSLDFVPGARNMVEGYISEGAQACAAAEGAEMSEDSLDAAAEGQSYRASRLGSAVRRLGCCSTEEMQRIESIADGSRTIATFDASGNVVGSTEIRGEQLRESALILRLSTQPNLDEEGQRALNESLYGNENGPQTEADRQRGMQRMRQAVADVEGENAARATTMQERNQAGQRAARAMGAIDNANGLRQRRAAVPPGMGPLADRMQAEADQNVNTQINETLRSFTNAPPGSGRRMQPAIDLPDMPQRKQRQNEQNQQPDGAAPEQPTEANLGDLQRPLVAARMPARQTGTMLG